MKTPKLTFLFTFAFCCHIATNGQTADTVKVDYSKISANPNVLTATFSGSSFILIVQQIPAGKTVSLQSSATEGIDLGFNLSSTQNSADLTQILLSATTPGVNFTFIKDGVKGRELTITKNTTAGNGLKGNNPVKKEVEIGVSFIHDAVLSAKKYNPQASTSLINEIAIIHTGKTFEELKTEPFWKNIKVSSVAVAGGKPDISAGILSSIGGLDVTNIADGIAKFLVKRTKQELTTAFFERFQQLLDSPEYKDLQIVFPQTSKTFAAIGTEIYNYQGYLTMMRESFEKDLRTLQTNIPLWFEVGYWPNKLDPQLKAKLAFVLGSAGFIYQSLSNNTHPGNMIEEFSMDATTISPNFQSALQTMQLVSYSLKGSNSNNYWSSLDSFKMVLADTTAFNVFMGLVYERAKTQNIKFDTTALTTILAGFNNKTNDFFVHLQAVLQQARLVEIKLAACKDLTEDNAAKYETWFDYFAAVIKLFKEGKELIVKTPINDVLKIDEANVNRFFSVTENSFELGLDISRRNYSSAIINVREIYDTLFYGAVNNAIAATDKHKFQDVLDKMLKYGAVAASVVEAKTSDEVAAAIEAAALPSGSSRIKRESHFNVALNAFVGINAGHEYITQDGSEIGKKSFFNTVGVSAPIGVALSWGQLGKGFKEGKGGSSFTLFASLIDLGAVTSFRFTNDSIAKLPTIQLKDILAPGLFVSYGLRRSPINFSGGYQFGPLLRKVGEETNETVSNAYTRWVIAAHVDIPFFNFVNRQYRK